MISCCALPLSHRPCRLWINQTKHKPWYCKYSPIRLPTTAPVNRNRITLAIGRDTCDYSCSQQRFGEEGRPRQSSGTNLLCIGGHLQASHLQSEVDFLSLSFYCVYFAVNQGGISCRCTLSFFFLCPPGQSQSRARWGCQQEKPLIDNVPKKPLCLHKATSEEKPLMGWSVPAHVAHRLTPPIISISSSLCVIPTQDWSI